MRMILDDPQLLCDSRQFTTMQTRDWLAYIMCVHTHVNTTRRADVVRAIVIELAPRADRCPCGGDLVLEIGIDVIQVCV